MNGPASWLKVLALCSTVALGGGYVWWSQKKAEEKQVRDAKARERMILPGSKSAFMPGDGKVEVPGAPTWLEEGRTNADSMGPAGEQKEDRTILPGSKSALVLPPDDEKKEPPPKSRTVLPGSKSIDPILSPDKAEEEP